MKQLFKATFEESLNLSDDTFVTFMNKDVNQLPDPTGGKKVVARVVGVLLLAFLIGINYLIAVISTKISAGELGPSPVPIPDINFLPIWLFYLLFFVWVTLVFIFRDRGEYYFTRIRAQFNLNLYIIWLVIEMNLLFITVFLKPLTILGMLFLLGLIGLVGYLVFRTKKRSLEYVLYEVERKKGKIDRLVDQVMKLAMKYGWGIVTVGIIWKFVFPKSEVRTDFVGFISILGMWIAMDSAIIFAEAYLYFPYLLHGYYKYKYPEEYRNWEGKSKLEWYGEKYFNKHIKGTAKEMKEEK
ncbi:hypothetical protein QJ527_01645 [Enterococcus mundtii]|uniref:hypothetical protein n=1 Tax=Enterococcus TaxID=1350 RepID=UPI00044EAB38|nr:MULTISPECIES: hypothetical protein [Enterococcus]AZP93457.1 hypothetical protein CYK55_10400 [Enterococcus mundtii]EYT96816.1 membrane protein [Enterococcus mundtii CRL35]MDA9427616.1 hypothetical protein [Enterococcus mundtii 1A]MDK4210253.1 hypothetical protein [Enterococcus mundtii]MDO7878244.1 hypothetical protein [Enterococcus mundtii]